MVRVVFDTVVFVRGLINPHGVWGRLIFESSASYVLFLSRPLLQETLEVVERPLLRQKYRAVVGRGMVQLLDILAQADVVEIGEIEAISRDPKDNQVLATAKAARAQYLVSEDQDLLVLSEYGGTKIVSVSTFRTVLAAGVEETSD
jgi:putative PIN family toxin of toxin-antitoxin system